MAFDRPTERWIICQRQASMPRSMDWLNGALMSIWQGRGSYRRGTKERLWVEPTRRSVCRAMKSRLISSPKTRIRQQHEKAHPQSVVTTGNNTSKWDGVFATSTILAQRRLKVYVAIRLCLAIFPSRVSCFVLCFFLFLLSYRIDADLRRGRPRKEMEQTNCGGFRVAGGGEFDDTNKRSKHVRERERRRRNNQYMSRGAFRFSLWG